MTMTMRVEIFPRDLGPTVQFYVDVLDFAVVRDESAAEVAYVALERGEVKLGAAARSHHRADLGHRRPPTGVELVLEVDDVEAELDRIQGRGWRIEEGLTMRPWGLRDFRLLDPDGYYLRITERTAQWTDSDLRQGR